MTPFCIVEKRTEKAMDYFCPHMTLNEVNAMSMLGLAHIGDGVYELLTRTMLCKQGYSAAAKLHRMTVSYVNAPAQAAAAKKQELAVYKRGRNAKVNSVPQKATEGEYHAATGLEALFGWLYLQGMTERIDALFSMIMEDNDAA